MPHGDPQAVIAARHQPVDHKVIGGHIAENTTGYPLLAAELPKAHYFLMAAFFKRQRRHLAPLAPVAQFAAQAWLVNGHKKIVKTGIKPGDVFIIQGVKAYILGQLSNRPTKIDSTADHANAGTLAHD